MCGCNRHRLDQQNIDYTYSYLFDNCKCTEDHEILVERCEICSYNLVSFARNYFLPLAAAVYM